MSGKGRGCTLPKDRDLLDKTLRHHPMSTHRVVNVSIASTSCWIVGGLTLEGAYDTSPSCSFSSASTDKQWNSQKRVLCQWRKWVRCPVLHTILLDLWE